MVNVREEVVNTLLAGCLAKRDLDAVPETVQVGGRPDVLIFLDGVRVVLEGRFSVAGLHETVKERVTKGMADIAVGVVYPKELKTAGTTKQIEKGIEAATFKPVILSYFQADGLHTVDHDSHTVDQLAESLRTVYRLQVKNDLVREQVDRVNEGIQEALGDAVNHGVSPTKALRLKLQKILGSGKSPGSDSTKDPNEMLRIAIFVLFDAMVFHDSVAAHHSSIKQLKIDGARQRSFLLREWKKILKIDYEPVFSVALQILDILPNTVATNRWLSKLAEKATEVVGSGILAKHDFMGRVFHKLLLRTTGAAYATYYTAVPSAWLLARLAVEVPEDNAEWSEYRILDPACGSGTLLSASYLAARDQRYMQGKVGSEELSELHQHLLEKVIRGWDVLWYATHLSLTTLALHNRDAKFGSSGVFTVPAGVSGHRVHLGSLDLLFDKKRFAGFGFGEAAARRSLAGRKLEDIPADKVDLVVMNPPFSRSSSPKKKFDYVDPEDSVRMTKALSELTKDLDVTGIGVAGLGAYFVLLGLELLKPNGRIAWVLPRSMLSGVSWEVIRRRVEAACEIEFIISNHDPGDPSARIEGWNWSEHTDIGEVMVIARRSANAANERQTRFVNLWRKPANEFDALSIARQVEKAKGDPAPYTLRLEGSDVGRSYLVPQSHLEEWNWLAPCVFASTDLIELISKLRWASKDWLIPFGTVCKTTGLDISPVKQYFSKSTTPSAFRMVWGHQAAMNTMKLPDSFMGYGASKKRTSGKAFTNWAARVLLAERPHLKTGCMYAMRAGKKCLTTAFWEISFLRPDEEDLFLLWFNSTPGILLMLASCTSDQGEIFKLKVGQLKEMPVLDPRHVDPGDFKAAMTSLEKQEFLPGVEEWKRAASGKGPRWEIDQLFKAHLPAGANLDAAYELLANEPVFTKARL